MLVLAYLWIDVFGNTQINWWEGTVGDRGQWWHGLAITYYTEANSAWAVGSNLSLISNYTCWCYIFLLYYSPIILLRPQDDQLFLNRRTMQRKVSSPHSVASFLSLLDSSTCTGRSLKSRAQMLSRFGLAFRVHWKHPSVAYCRELAQCKWVVDLCSSPLRGVSLHPGKPASRSSERWTDVA